MIESIRTLAARFLALLHCRSLDRDLDAELRSHLDMAIERNLAQGMNREQACRQALRDFGGVEQTRQSYRERRGLPFLDTLLQDLRFAFRMLRKSPGFTAVAVLTLALGIGANTAIFSVVDAVLLKPLPYRNPERLTIIWQSDAAHRASGAWFDTYREFEQWAQYSKSFEKLAALTWAHGPMTVRLRGKLERVLGIPVTSGFFSTLGVEAAHGRTLAPADSQNACAVVLSDAFWHGELGGTDIVGGTLVVDDKPCLVAGIMPKDFSFYPKLTQLWILIPPQDEYAKHPWESMVGVVGLLAPGVTRASGEAELTTLQARIISEAPPESVLRKAEPVVLDLQSEFVWLTARNLRVSLILLFAAVTFVLLIACGNVATLFLGRAAERQTEFGIRAALGSSRLRIIRQLLTESLLLSISGAALGIFLAAASIRYLNAANPVELPPGNPITINWQILAFTAFLAILSAALFGLAPAWKASRYDVNAVLKKEGRSHLSSKYFVVSEVALSLVLLAGAALMIESLHRLISTPLGFEPAHLLAGNIDLPAKTYSTADQRLNFYNALKSGVLDIPGVQGVAFAPLSFSGSNALSLEGKRGEYHGALANDVSEAAVDMGYFRVTEIPLLKGREFDITDQQKTLPVAIVNEALADKYFHGDPIGQHIKLGKPEDKNPWLTVVGVVGNVKGFVVFKEMGYVTDPCVYLPLTQSPDSRVAILVRSGQDPKVLSPAIRGQFSRLDGSLPPLDLTTMHDWLSQFYTQPRLRAFLLSIFGSLGLVLCSIGIFGVVSQSVAQRRQEIGIRMALGAQQRDTLHLVLREAMRFVAVGILIGVAGALALTPAVSGLLYAVTPTDPQTIAAVAVLLIFVALAACYIPARRAMRVDPMVALRYE